MAILSVKYPIQFTQAGSYEYGVYHNNVLIYKGSCYDGSVDISSLLQSYMNSDEVELDIPASGYNLETGAFVKEFQVRVTGSSATQSYLVANDYNDAYVTEYASAYITSGSVTDRYYPGGLFFADVNAPSGSSTIVLNGTTIPVSSTSGHLTTRSVTSLSIAGQVVPITLSDGCERFSLYWVNRLGGRSQLLLEGKCAEKYASKVTQFQTSYDMTSPQSFQKRTIVNQVTKSFVLRTGLLTDDQSRKMDDLFTSPKVWLHDHDTDQILAVTVTDKNMTLKTRKNDKMFTYTINVAQAQEHIRR